MLLKSAVKDKNGNMHICQHQYSSLLCMIGPTYIVKLIGELWGVKIGNVQQLDGSLHGAHVCSLYLMMFQYYMFVL